MQTINIQHISFIGIELERTSEGQGIDKYWKWKLENIKLILWSYCILT